MVVNCTAEMEHKSQKIVVVAAAEKYLGLRGFIAEQLQRVLSGNVLSYQTIPTTAEASMRTFYENISEWYSEVSILTAYNYDRL